MTEIRIFLFEDEWMCREAIQAIVDRAAGLALVGSAANAEMELETAIALKPDIVLMDLRLKGAMNGIQASRRLIRRCPDTRIIIFTHHGDDDNLRSAVQAGVSGYLLKEEISNPDILIEAIHEISRGNSYMTPAICSQILDVIRKRDDDIALGLTRREVEVLKLISAGLRNREIAAKLGIHDRTVANHVSNILYKVKAKNRTQAASIARSQGLA